MDGVVEKIIKYTAAMLVALTLYGILYYWTFTYTLNIQGKVVPSYYDYISLVVRQPNLMSLIIVITLQLSFTLGFPFTDYIKVKKLEHARIRTIYFREKKPSNITFSLALLFTVGLMCFAWYLMIFVDEDIVGLSNPIIFMTVFSLVFILIACFDSRSKAHDFKKDRRTFSLIIFFMFVYYFLAYGYDDAVAAADKKDYFSVNDNKYFFIRQFENGTLLKTLDEKYFVYISGSNVSKFPYHVRRIGGQKTKSSDNGAG